MVPGAVRAFAPFTVHSNGATTCRPVDDVVAERAKERAKREQSCLHAAPIPVLPRNRLKFCCNATDQLKSPVGLVRRLITARVCCGFSIVARFGAEVGLREVRVSLSRMWCVLCAFRLCAWSAHVQSEWFGVMSRRRDVLEESGACRRRYKGWREVCVLFSDVVLVVWLCASFG